MNKILSMIIFLCVILFPSAVYAEEIPEIFNDYVKCASEATEYKTITKFDLINPQINFEPVPDFITKPEALEDLELFAYLWKNAYAGSFYWEKHGIDFAALYKETRRFIENSSGEIEVLKFERLIADGLKEMRDGHFAIKGKEHFCAFKKFLVLFTDVLLEKDNQNYVVIASPLDKIPLGSEYKGPKENLFKTLSPEGKDHFLLGNFERNDEITASPTSTFRFRHDKIEEDVKLPLHLCRVGECGKQTEKVYEVKTGTNFISMIFRTFDFKFDPELKNLAEVGKSLRETDALILNLLNNEGGDAEYFGSFTEGVNEIYNSRYYKANLVSPPIVQAWANIDYSNLSGNIKDAIVSMVEYLPVIKKKPMKEWNFDVENESKQGSFRGKAYMLINRNTASSGEDAVNIARSSFENIVVIGENTLGITTFADQLQYKLKNSKIILFLCSAITPTPGLQEGYGQLPDIWLDSSNPDLELEKWLSNPKGYRSFLK